MVAGRTLALLAFVAFVLSLMGCAVTSSGNILGEAAVLKYSKGNNKYRFIDVGILRLNLRVEEPVRFLCTLRINNRAFPA